MKKYCVVATQPNGKRTMISTPTTMGGAQEIALSLKGDTYYKRPKYVPWPYKPKKAAKTKKNSKTK